MKTRYAVDEKDLFIEIEHVPVDMLVNIPVMDKNDKMLGRAILTKTVYPNRDNGTMKVDEVVVLTDIIVYDPEDRGKGIGNQLMCFITTSGYFDVIITGISTEAGRSLCLKWGFKQEDIKGTKLLIWRKENNSEL
jgi:hypothetical protein